MGHASPFDDHARFRAELRRSGAMRNSLAAAAFRQSIRRLRDRIAAWLRQRAEAKEAASRPRSSAG